ncbi:MAG: antitoxin of toxin-antitoxin stability system [Defluviicoccus sp.]|nr:antitoxin of toxin-antitoxin stability system [Defluviicoccus sp.]
MPRVIEITVYTIDELSDAAKETARAWYRETCLEHEWYDAVFEDFETICRILGVTLRTSPVRLMGGGTREKPHLFFRGFSSQGDGASFEGQYCHAKGAARAIRAHAPKDEELHRIADELQAVQKRNFYQLGGSIRTRGNYCHEHSMAIEVERDSPTWQPMTDGTEDAVIEALRDLARWFYRQLEREYDYLTSDTAVDESIAINGYTFTAEGRRFG